MPHQHPTRSSSGDFAPTVLMPGPRRAKHIAEAFLTDAQQVNGVRGMLAFTGEYLDSRVSVMEADGIPPFPFTPRNYGPNMRWKQLSG